MRKKQEFLSKR